jgi:hypothetical protein
MNLKDSFNQLEKELGIRRGGDYFSFERGNNQIRLLTEWVPIASHRVNGKNYTCYGEEEGCPYHGEDAPVDEKGNQQKVRVRFVTYVLSRADNQIYLAFLPYSVVKSIVDLSTQTGWEFNEFPMPYDIVVKYDPDASPTEMYKVFPSPSREPVSSEILTALSVKTSPEEIVERIKEKAKNAVS